MEPFKKKDTVKPKPGMIVELIHNSPLVEKVDFCDTEDVHEHTRFFPWGTVGTIMRVVNSQILELFMEDECVYFAQAKDCRIVTSYEGSIKEIQDKISRTGKDKD